MVPEPILVPGPDGRRVAVQQYGDPNGQPVFFIHGWPSCRLQGALGDEAARELRMRFLSIDRPGIGASDFHPDRKLSDWPTLMTAVADHFRIGTFRIAGVSGGGPYTLISAHALRDRVEKIAVVSGAPPIADMTDTRHLMPAYQILLALYHRVPEVMRLIFRLMQRPMTVRPPLFVWQMVMLAIPKCDREALDNPPILDRAWAGFAGAWKGHVDGVYTDACIYAQPWGFKPEEIRCPVDIWHGKEDRNFRVALAEEMATRIKHGRLEIVANEGHYSLIMRRIPEILKRLKETDR